MPNILLSHNPNSFPRAAELGIELSLAGHTHGGQVKVEIVDHSVSPARLITPFVAGLYRMEMQPSAVSHPASGNAHDARSVVAHSNVAKSATLEWGTLGSGGAHGNSIPPGSVNGTSKAALYVNRGLGTFGFPVRLGVPPEITLLTLRRA
jgi:predicted MPP superfamily phosphohydrolase